MVLKENKDPKEPKKKEPLTREQLISLIQMSAYILIEIIKFVLK